MIGIINTDIVSSRGNVWIQTDCRCEVAIGNRGSIDFLYGLPFVTSETEVKNAAVASETEVKNGARYWVRTSDPLRVREVLYH